MEVYAGGSITSSSTKAEYVGLPEITKEIINVKQSLETMGIKFSFLIYIKVDNVGEIYLNNKFSLC
jgi:hypothetical protein